MTVAAAGLAAVVPCGGCGGTGVPQGTDARALGRGEVGAERLPGMGAVARTSRHWYATYSALGSKAVSNFFWKSRPARYFGAVGAEIGRDVFPLSVGHINLDQSVAAAAGSVADAHRDVGILGIGRDDAEFRRGHRAPVGEVDLAPVAAAAIITAPVSCCEAMIQ